MVKEWDLKDKKGTCSSLARCESTRKGGKGGEVAGKREG